MQEFQDILFIQGYAHNLSKEEYAGDGFFILPLSKENIRRNLERISQQSAIAAKKQLTEFLERYKGNIEIKDHGHDFTYSPQYRHSYVRNRCYSYDRGFYDTETGISLKEELAKEAEKVFSGYQPDCESIYKRLIEKIKTVKDLIFLAAIRKISELNYSAGEPAGIRDSLDLKKYEFDKRIVEKLTGFSSKFSEFAKDREIYFKKYLPADSKSFLLLNAHSFNTSSCCLVKYLYFHPKLSEFILYKLNNFALESSLKKTYSSKLSEFEQKYGEPAFENKNREFQFLEKIYQKLSDDRRVFTFEADEYAAELKALCSRGMLRIEEDEDIKINNKEKFTSYYWSLREKELARIDFIMESFIKEWLSTKVKIEEGRIVFAEQTIEQPEPKEKPKTEITTKIPVAAPQSVAKTEKVSVPLPGRLKVFLGQDKNQGRVFWEPGTLFNGHFIIVGSSGVGKTETIRCIASELSNQGFPVLMIDFHGDMACENCDIKTYRISEKSEYYFNPLELDPQFKDITPLTAGREFIEAVQINFPSIGIQQRDRLKEIIKEAYEELGINNDKATWSIELPFKHIEEKIKVSKDKETQTLKGYMRDVFDYGLFSGSQKISMRDILYGKITHINLKPLPESLRSLYADLLLRKLYYSLQAIEEIPVGNIKDKDKFRVFVIIDEAKLLVKENQGVKAVLNKYATEIRKYGGALILASQLITHFNKEILNNIAVKLCMKVENKEEARLNSKFFDVNEKELLNLARGEGIFVVSHQNGIEKKKIKIVPTWERNQT